MLPCIGLGAAPFIMQSTESILVLCFNSSLLKIRRGPGGRCDDDPVQCDAVCDAAAAGTDAGRTADHQL